MIAKVGDNILYLLARTCTFEVEGAEEFVQLAGKENCILMLWHNRLALVPYLLSRHTKGIRYAALVSASRDGEILTYVAKGYENGSTIQVPHLGRYKALQGIIRRLGETEKIVIIITPDGPRGPRYELKPGIALAALETHARVVPLDWEAVDFWELKTWDKLRLPKPFTTIRARFLPPVGFGEDPKVSLHDAMEVLAKSLPG